MKKLTSDIVIDHDIIICANAEVSDNYKQFIKKIDTDSDLTEIELLQEYQVRSGLLIKKGKLKCGEMKALQLINKKIASGEVWQAGAIRKHKKKSERTIKND